MNAIKVNNYLQNKFMFNYSKGEKSFDKKNLNKILLKQKFF